MAKTCEVCKQIYPDELPFCPHCAKAARAAAGQPVSEEDINLGLAPEPTGPTSSLSGIEAVEWAALTEDAPSAVGKGESAVDLGAMRQAGETPSGESDVAWADLAAEPAPQTGSQPGAFDAPSDADLRARGLSGQPPAGDFVAGAEPGAGAPALASEQEMARDLFVGASGESGVDLGALAESSGSDVRLAGASGLHHGQESDVHLASADDALGLEGPHEGRRPAEGGSGRDLIAEEVESGVGLLGSKKQPATPPPAPVPEDVVDLGSGDVDLPPERALSGSMSASTPPQPGQEVIDLEGLPQAGPSSGLSHEEPAPSAVDLGSRYDMVEDLDSVPAGAKPAESEAGIDLGEMAEAEAAESGLRLPGPDAPAPTDEQTAEYRPTEVGGQRPISTGEFTPYDESVAEPTEEQRPSSDESILAEDAELERATAPEAAEEEGVEEVPAEAAEDEGELVGAGRGGREAPPAPRPLARAVPWLGGTALGLILGAGATLGVQSLRGPSGPAVTNTVPGSGTQPGTGAPQGQPPANTVAERGDFLRHGDLDRAAKAGIEQAKEDDPEQLAQRGEYRWLTYLQKQRQAQAPIKADDPAVQQAKADLSRAGKNPDAMFWLGHIDEMTNRAEDARKTYAQGAEEFKADPVQRRRFQAALERLQLRGAAGAAGAALLPRPGGAALAALLAVALQQPEPPAPKDKPAGRPRPKRIGGVEDKPGKGPAPGPKDADDAKKGPPAPGPRPGSPPAGDTDEAGNDFWEAVGLARQQKYDQALKLLDRARAQHDKRRFLNLRRAQNPLSDPTEEIFLRSCDEMKAYWQIQERLQKGKYLEPGQDPVKVVDELAQKAAEGGSAGKMVQSAADALIKDRIIENADELPKGVEKVLTERKDALAKAADLDKALKASRDEARELGTKLKDTQAELADRADKLKAAAASEAKLKEDLGAEQKVLGGVAADLREAKWLDAGAGKGAIPQALANALKMAAVKDPESLLRTLQARTARDEAELKERWRPEEMLAFWLPLLDDNRTRADLARDALRDADRVAGHADASPADRARAEVVRGLALRNEEKFAAAQEALVKGLGGLTGDPSPFRQRAEAALREVADPPAWLAGRARRLYEQGQTAQALALLNRALESMPAKEQPAVLAERSLMQLDLARARARGPVPPGDPALAAARADAAEAAKAGLAEGLYAAGRVAEEMGRLGEAAGDYRKALAAHPALDAVGGRYRMALARVLVAPREARPPAFAPPAPKGAEVPATRLDLPADGKSAALQLAALICLVEQGAVTPPGPGQQEAERLADEILKAPEGTVPFDVRAQALAVKGLYTRALQTYAEGLRRHLPGTYAEGLVELVRIHPRLARPDSLATPNPLQADRHFADGVNFYFDGDYAQAERAFLEAVANDGQDARFYYFLGLARLALGKAREAQEDLDQGAALERLGRPSPAAVGAALERVQGRARQIVNEARSRPR
jgi:tetratricopeptide (TPR) repeat protein